MLKATDRDLYISVTDAVNLLKVSRATLYKWLAQGRLNGQEIAGRTVIVRDYKFDRASTRPAA
jgi:excisionase family DNA binding protein